MDSAEAMPKKWFVLRVQSGKEDTIRRNLEKRVKAAGLEEEIGRVLVPSETVAEIRRGKRTERKRKKFPGYIFVEMGADDKNHVPEQSWFLIRETPGIGDFVGPASRPSPMSGREVEKMLGEEEKADITPAVPIGFKAGDSVKIKEGPFENFDGVIDEVYPNKGTVKVIVTIFGRGTPVELEYWQVESN